MKKILSLIFLCVFCLNEINAEVTWELSEDGTLTISGTGDMNNYSYQSYAPWFSQRESIKKVIINNSITSIGDYAFYACSNITSITIPNSVKCIGECAFDDCTVLTSITIPNSVLSISDFAFRHCTGLTSITIPNNVTNIAESAFIYCSGIISIKVEDKNKYYDSRNNCNAIIRKSDNTLIAGCKNTIIPNEVTCISGFAFRGCIGLTSITIPNSVISIGTYAFYKCTSLTNIILSNILTNIDSNTFYNCFSLTSITIPNNVTNIGEYAFLNCFDLTSVTIGNSVTSIGEGAFWACEDLISITIPNNVTTIGKNAFMDCSSLKKATIEVNKNLEIGDCVFTGSSLEELIINGESLPKSTSDIFADGLYETTTLYVPYRLYEEYCSTSPWNNFKNIVKLPDEPINLIDGNTFTNDKQHNRPEISYTRTFNNTKWQALYIPFSLNFNDWKDNFEIAYINGVRQLDKDDNGTIDETIMDVIKIKSGLTTPNMPYLIKAKTTGEKTFSVTNATIYPAEENSIDCSTTIAKYTFTGTYNTIPSATMIANNYYGMGGGDLIQSDGSNDLKPYRWYMKVESRNPSYNASNAAKTITINVIDEEGETTTGVNELRMTNYESPVYDLNGRKVNENNLKSGIYIKNGKKFVVK